MGLILMLVFVLNFKGLQEKLLEEQNKARGDLDSEPKPLSLELLEEMPMLHACVRETLRLRQVLSHYDVTEHGAVRVMCVH